jgi:hypothetical protein
MSAASVGRWRNYEAHLAPLQHLTALAGTALPAAKPAGSA